MDPFGLLNVNKPAGVSSRYVVDRVERLLRPAKVGHAGTLDPLAVGVLVVCVGQATRLIQYVQQMPKHYRATFLLGKTSETDDTEGELFDVPNVVAPTASEIEHAILPFLGDIQQRPPIHSAIKIGGKRAYQLARRGHVPELQSRPVTIYSIQVRKYAYPELELDVTCGSGTYIRSLGRDLGESLQTGAVMSALKRTSIGEFRIQQAVDAADLTSELIVTRLQPALSAVPALLQVTLTPAQLLEIRNGRPILASWLAPQTYSGPKLQDVEIAALNQEGNLAAIIREKKPGELWPVINFQKYARLTECCG